MTGSLGNDSSRKILGDRVGDHQGSEGMSSTLLPPFKATLLGKIHAVLLDHVVPKVE